MPAALAKAIPATITGAVAHLRFASAWWRSNTNATKHAINAATLCGTHSKEAAQEVICESFHHSISASHKRCPIPR